MQKPSSIGGKHRSILLVVRKADRDRILGKRLPHDGQRGRPACLPLSTMKLLTEFLFAGDSRALTNREQLVGCHISNRFYGAVGPTDGKVRRSFGAKSKVQATVISGVKARLSGQFLCLTPTSIMGDHT